MSMPIINISSQFCGVGATEDYGSKLDDMTEVWGAQPIWIDVNALW